MDDDSEAEKLSPLLQNDVTNVTGLALHMEDVVDAIDDTDTDHDERTQSHSSEKLKNGITHFELANFYAQWKTKTLLPVFLGGREERGDESDYYTPEEPAPVQGPLYDGGMIPSSIESTPQRLPGTPLSHASARSSGDSYTSGSSTRHLLAVNNANNAIERTVKI